MFLLACVTLGVLSVQYLDVGAGPECLLRPTAHPAHAPGTLAPTVATCVGPL